MIFKELSELGLKNKVASKIAKISAEYDHSLQVDLFSMEVVEQPNRYSLFIDVHKIRYELAESMLPDDWD